MLWHLKGNGTKQLGHAKMDGTAKHKIARTTHWEHSIVSTRIWNAQQKYIPIRYIVSKRIAFDFQAGVTWDLKKGFLLLRMVYITELISAESVLFILDVCEWSPVGIYRREIYLIYIRVPKEWLRVIVSQITSTLLFVS